MTTNDSKPGRRRRDSVLANPMRIRQLQGLQKQEDFARSVGIARSTLAKIYAGGRVDFGTLESIARKSGVSVDELILRDEDETRLAGQIGRLDLWQTLSQILGQLVIVMSAAAMRTYTEEASAAVNLGEAKRLLARTEAAKLEVKNATIEADLEATLAGIRLVETLLRPVADTLSCGMACLSEETIKHFDALRESLGDAIRLVKKPQEFYTAEVRRLIRLLIDELDGSKNLVRHLAGLFVSAAALLIEDQPRVAAVFDPTAGTLVTGCLFGPYADPSAAAYAIEWQINTGRVVDLVAASARPSQPLSTAGVAVHFPRSDAEARQKMIERIDRLAVAADSIYSLNTGIGASLRVARSDLAAFVNPSTERHDLAAAEVIARACKATVCDWSGKSIDYARHERTSVVVARAEHRDAILELLR
jgi:fructose-1,6-bisphosphatase/inositol monophosphatase family enzyme/transcriptional regulator with XRE-family HTH domain